jgi:signal transduction histidine kinase
LLVYAVVGVARYNQIRLETEVRLDRALRIAEEHAQRVLETNETVLARVMDALGDGDDAAIRLREPALHDQLIAMSRTKPQIHSILVLGADGRALVSDRVFPVPPAMVGGDRSSFKWHSEGNPGLHLSEPWLDPATGAPFFDTSRGRSLPDGAFGGTVSVSLSAAYFESFHGDLAADEPGLAITMLREDGVILSRWPSLPGAPTRLAEASPVMTWIRNGLTRGSGEGLSSVDQRERLLTFGKVGEYPIFLATGMDLREIRRRWQEEMTWLAAFGLPPLFGLFLAARVALRRTREVLEAAQRLNEEMVARRRVEESLLQSQKLEALGRLTGGVAHDFNNALMVISNNLFLLQRKHPEIDRARIDSIGRAVGSATKLTRQLLAFSRRQALVPEHLRLQDRLPTFRDLLEPVLGSQVLLSVSVAAETFPIVVDPAEFELALINLAVNARDAMPDGGRFRLAARNAAGDELPPKANGPMVMVEASDTGTGIEPAILDKVFEPFFTTKPVGTGTGLGLSQIYGLCQRAGGLATIHSEVGTGTTVRLFFPASTERPADGPGTASAAPGNLGKTILLVEDNDEVAAALQPVLQMLGCHVTRVDRAEAALGWLRRQTLLPDVVLTDVVMPGEMDGVGLAQTVRTRFPSVRIILMTGYAEQLEAISRQGFEILPKPCSAEVLGAAIGRARPSR